MSAGRRLTEWQRAAILRDYRETEEKIEVIALRHGVRVGHVVYLVDTRGVPRRRPDLSAKYRRAWRERRAA